MCINYLSSLRGAVFDHSCEPNAEVVFDGITLFVRANQDIPQRDINKDDKMLEVLIDGKEAEEQLKNIKEKQENLEKMVDQHANLLSIEEECRKEIEIQDKVLGKTNIYWIKSLNLAFNVCISLKKWIDAIRFGNLLTEPYRFYYGLYSRHLGIHLFKIGKIQLFYGSPVDAEDVLKQAENIMKVTYGEQHFLYQDLVKLLAEIQK
ncbi:UNVERIFIED_CONTAM: Histone-lysine N-methyltransferase SMYD3 [Trichonephila clavipes]